MGLTLAFIPSPHTGVVHIGPLTLHMYGLTLLVAILACIWLTGKRWVAMGGDWDLVTRVAVWGVGFGVVGARLYHDLTSWSEVPSPKWKGIFEVWQGGLGVWGGILFGTIAGAIVVHRAGYSVTKFMDAVAPGLLLAQGIGRIGNWWNQELFGKPTTLPWGLEDRPSEPADPVLQPGDLPPDVPLRADLGLRGRRPADLGREAVADPAARPVRALRRLLHASDASSRNSCVSIRRTTSPGCA